MYIDPYTINPINISPCMITLLWCMSNLSLAWLRNTVMQGAAVTSGLVGMEAAYLCKADVMAFRSVGTALMRRTVLVSSES